MTEPLSLLLVGMIAPPLALVGVTYVAPRRERVRAEILVGAGASALAAGAILLTGLASDEAGGDVLVDGPGRGALVVVDQFSLPLFPMAAALWLAVLLVAPARSFTAAAVRRSALAYACVLAGFATRSPIALAALLIAGSAIFLLEHRAVHRVARVAGIYLGVSGALFGVTAVLLEAGVAETVAVWMAVGGLLIRKGIVPGHSWMPDSFEFGHLVPSLLFHLPQVGTYAAVVLVLPTAPDSALTMMAVLGLVSALYGAVLAVAEADARRAFGYIFMAQSALVLAGIVSDEQEGVAGGLSVWVASSLSLCGMGLALAALELRRGRLSLRDRHGGYEQMNLLGPSFLVLGLASIGFPGTLGFLGVELLIGGTIERFPAFGFVTIGVTALNGITVIRMYFSLFCGRRAPDIMLPLRTREIAVFAGLAALLVVTGLAPKYMVESRIDAAEVALAGRSDHP